MHDMDMIFDRYRGRRYHIVGIARSGVSLANLLHAMGAPVSLSDRSGAGELGSFIGEVHPGVSLYPGRQDRELLAGVECLVPSPGVPSDEDIVMEARRSGVEVIGEIELSWRILRDLAAAAGLSVRWFGVTGTNGKSTTATLLAALLNRSGATTILAGNIGNPLAGEVLAILERMRKGAPPAGPIDIVLELSSFQLETVRDFHLDASALLNITDDHMDRYDDFEAYARAKAGIFINQGSGDIAVLNGDDDQVMARAAGCAARKYFVSVKRRVEGACLHGEDVVLTTGSSPFVLVPRKEIRIPGLHNLYNAMTASLVAHLAGIPARTIADVLRAFPGLEHRLEYLGEIRGVRFFNDSKGTNVGAVVKSLESFDRGIILLAGGRDKNSDFSVLNPVLRGRVKKMVLIGEAAEKIAHAVHSVVPVEQAAGLEDAVRSAFGSADRGDTVLLSPACASFDMFRNFEDRGRQFKDIVARMREEEEKHERSA